MVEVWRHAGPIRVGQISRHHLDPGQPPGVGVGAPTPQISGTAAGCHVDQPRCLEIDQAGHIGRGPTGSGGLEAGLVDAQLIDFADPVGPSTSGVPCSTTAFMSVHQHTPNSRATCATGRACSPTCRHTSAPARRVNMAVVSSASTCSFGPRLPSARPLPATPPPLPDFQAYRPPENTTGHAPLWSCDPVPERAHRTPDTTPDQQSFRSSRPTRPHRRVPQVHACRADRSVSRPSRYRLARQVFLPLGVFEQPQT